MGSHGEANRNAKLTEQDVLEIRKSRETVRTLAARYGVSYATISLARLGRTWKHLPMPTGNLNVKKELEKWRRRQ